MAAFDGGPITSDDGALLLRQVEHHLSLSDQVAVCFTDHRDPKRILYSRRGLIPQRIVGIALGYEDLNDHDQLCHDPLMALVSEKRREDSTPLAGKSTLNRLEHAPTQGPGRYHKIDLDPEALQALLVELFTQTHPRPGRRRGYDRPLGRGNDGLGRSRMDRPFPPLGVTLVAS